jgi:ABC-type transport system involved in cytochrome bd biosynthesis fused ATPase/permease subunit
MGTMFNNRRQSRDRILCEKVVSLVGDGRLFISEYSRELFENFDISLVCGQSCLFKAEKGDFCFVEGESLLPYEEKIESIEAQLAESDKDIGEWNDMNELFSKTLRYGLLDTLIPHINKSIKYYMTKLEQEYTVKYDQEFKPHIYIDNNDTEISYKDLSTGQRKTLDIAIIFGVIQNVIANVDFNIFFLDELFSNMDSDSRNTMLTLLKETLSENRTIFVVNHSEMSDDFFNHKIRVHLNTKRIIDAKKKEEVNVKASKYEKIF